MKLRGPDPRKLLHLLERVPWKWRTEPVSDPYRASRAARCWLCELPDDPCHVHEPQPRREPEPEHDAPLAWTFKGDR